MSALSLSFNRDASPIDEAAFADSMNRLRGWGVDGCDAWLGEGVAVGHQHFWLMPEEKGERQPLIDERYVIAMVGRIDNRDELLRRLGIDQADGAGITDAALMLRCFRAWGKDAFGRVLGGFLAVIVDRKSRSVTLARDALGDFSIFYVLDERRLIAATEPQALFAHAGVSNELNEQSMVRWFALKMPLEGETRFKAIHELPRATILTVTADQVDQGRYWEPEITQIRYREPSEYAEHFRDLLEQAVRRCLRCAEPPVVLMSGGYDSTSIGAMIGKTKLHPLKAVSWVFDRFPESDERRYTEALVQMHGGEAAFINCDQAAPFAEHDAMVDANTPLMSPYLSLQRRVYQAAADGGARLALVGWFGNHLYAGGFDWLAEHLQAGRVREFAANASDVVWRKGLIGALGREDFKRVRRWSVKRVTGIARFRPIRKAPRWMLPDAADALIDDAVDVPAGMRGEQFHATIGQQQAHTASFGQVYPAKAGLRLAYPYRDRQLIEFMLGIPAHQLYDGLHMKAIAFHALEGLLPEVIRQRHDYPIQLPVYLAAIRESRAAIRAEIDAPDALWRRYIDEKALREAIDAPDESMGKAAMLAWYSFSIERWRRREW